jgi:hypothetical protein
LGEESGLREKLPFSCGFPSGCRGSVALELDCGSLLRQFGSVRSGWRKRQLGSAAQNASFFRRELFLVGVAVNLTLARFWRHCPQGLDGISHSLPPLRRELLHLGVQLPRRVFLLRRQVPPGVHAIQHLLTLLRRQVVETIKLILQLLLLLRRKVAELGIVFKCLFLLLGRQVLMLAQPLSGVSVLLRLRMLGGGVGSARMVGLRQRRNNACQHQRESR